MVYALKENGKLMKINLVQLIFELKSDHCLKSDNIPNNWEWPESASGSDRSQLVGVFHINEHHHDAGLKPFWQWLEQGEGITPRLHK